MSDEKTTSEKDIHDTKEKNTHKQHAECSCAQSTRHALEKKQKNLIAILILLAGIAAGSFFFDIAQLVRGQGFSQKAVRSAKVVEHAGKTWVSYDDPKVHVDVYAADDCVDCVTDEVLVWLRRIVPTIVAEKKDVRDEDIHAEAENNGVKYIPAFVFSKEIEKTDFFAQAGILFEQYNDTYTLKTTQLGVPVGEYIAAPSLTDAIVLGNDDAAVTLIEYSDFACPFCKSVHPIIEQAINEFGDKVRYVYKHFPLTFENPRAADASLAAECAHAQEKFLPYANILFARQDQWSKTQGNERFNAYAREIGLDAQIFTSCMSDETLAEKVQADLDEAIAFGLTGTPALFVNDQFLSGVVTYETLKGAIEDALGTDEETDAVAVDSEGQSSVEE